jgi:hypothetical protein
MSSAATETAVPRTTSRVALIGLDAGTATVLTECFRQFKISTVVLSPAEHSRLKQEKFEGCALRLADPNAEAILQVARNSASNRAMVVYGISDHQTARQFSKYGINAVLADPIERAPALKAVRSTYLLAVHEFRRYVRVPVAIAVDIDADGRRLSALSQEVSSGGMSLEVPDLLADTKAVSATFTLPGMKTISIRGNICWRREKPKMFGVRFDTNEPTRQTVREWIDKFLDSQS